MEGISTDLGKTFVEKLINGVIGKSRYLFCYKCIANEFELEKEKLEAEWETMTQRFTKAKEKGKDIQSNAQFWEKQANKLIQEDTKLKQRCFFGFCPDCIWLYKRGEELANKTEEIKKLMVKGEKLENVEVTRSLPDVERYSSQSYISFKTRESKYNELLNALKDDSYYTIGLHGMGGTGKTTMAKEVGKQLKTSMQFNRVSFTTVSNTPNIKKIQDDIAGHLELEWRATNESTRPTQLWDRLTKGEKILVILDDVWDDLNFEDIGIPNSDNHKGCKVLVTTRYLKVCKQMSCAKTIQLDLLSEEEAWEMFKRHAELSNISSKNILDQGSKIALECKGLPIAIALIARSLKGEKRQENWDAALNSLQNPMPMAGVDDTKVDIYKCLKFSYDNLKDKKAKELFLLCSIFQEDEEISTEILTRLGIGIGLFGEDYKKYNHARTLVVVAKDNLLDSCLLLSTNKRDVKMHDLIREVAQWIANKEILAVDFSNKYLLFEGNPMDLCSSGFDGSKLKILIFIVDNGCFVDSFFKSIAGLLVLNLRAGKQSTISLPQSIRSLTNIHSLLIESVNLGDISVLGSLQSLETLDLNQCTIEELPQEIAKLKKLRLLNLEMCEIIDKNPFEVIQRCPSLEELYFRVSFNDSCQEITLPALERYQLIENFRKMYDFSLSKCVSLQDKYLSEATVKHVIPTAEILRLEGTKKGWRNLMPEIVPIHQGMNDLIELRLKDFSQLECLIDTKHIGSPVPNVFSKLDVLKLIKMNNLKELCNGPISSDFLNNLKELTLKSCSTLVSVFDLSTSQSLLQLERLVIRNCEQLKNIVTNERKSDDKSCNILFPKLKQLGLGDVPNFIGIFPESNDLFEGSSHSISKPQTQLEVEPIKSNKFPWSHVCCYGYNNKLRDSSSSTSTKIPIPSVYEDQPQHCSISLESYCLLRLSHVMCNIKEIALGNIPRIKSVFTLSVASKMLLLESLTIYSCDEMEHIVVDNGDGSSTGVNIVFPKLEELCVNNCKKLEYIFGNINASDLHNYLHLPALRSLYLNNLPSLIGMGTKNYHTILSHLAVIRLYGCPKVESIIGDFVYSMSKSQDSTTIKDLSGYDLEPHLALQQLTAKNSKFQCFFYLDEINGQQRNLGLKEIDLDNLAQMTYLFVGPKNCFSLQNLLKIKIVQCEKLEMIFSTCVLKCLPQLLHLMIDECDELQYIIEEDHVENKEISNDHMFPIRTCFPKLKTLVVRKCNKLNYVFPASICTELPELLFLVIQEACKLQKIFGGSEENDQKVGIPNLRIVVFVELPSFFQGIQFQTVKHRLVHNCQKLSLNSTSTSTDVLSTLMGTFYEHELDYELGRYMRSVKKELEEHFKAEDTSGGNLNGTVIQSSTSGNENAIEDVDHGGSQEKTQTNNKEPSKEESESTSRHELTSTQELMNPKQPVAEIDTNVKPSHENNLEGSTSGETAAGTLPAISGKKNEPTIQIDIAPKQKIKMKQEAEAKHEFVEKVPDLEIPPVAILPTDSKVLMNEQSMDQQMKTQQSDAEIDITAKHSLENNLEGSTPEKTAAGTLFTSSRTKNEPPIHLDIALKQKDIEISVEEGTTLTIAMEDINNLMEEDPLLALVALENLLTGQVSISSVRVLLQELKTLMDSSSDLDHLVSNQESKSKLISLLHQLNQHQGMLTSDEKDFVEKVQNFFNDNIIKHTTSQQLLKKYNQVLDSKTDLMNKLRSAKSAQTDIDRETSTTNAQIHELSLQTDELRKKLADLENQIEGLKSVANTRDVQKMKLKAECSELAQQSKELLSALASLEVNIREAERARNLAKEGFANLKSSFPRL
ncbi:uncharacterized protein LOC123916725 isoform X2 [Trifolium pratense]|uniref:uncharacterized protein LOC123916725 isoform X2 n=1 Tax=Trifolium pratense TaxID=57577 RepID=UPI001E693472|nr:uncharacterized protein LOC123916725 isoform X2 [Trifolium pratense]